MRYLNYTIKMPARMKRAWAECSGVYMQRSALVRAFINKLLKEYKELGPGGIDDLLNGNFSLVKAIKKD